MNLFDLIIFRKLPINLSSSETLNSTLSNSICATPKSSILCASEVAIYEIFIGLKQNELSILEKLINVLNIQNFDISASLISVEIMQKLKKKGQRINMVDVFIGSIAIANNLTLITSDKDFTKIDDLKILIF